MLSLKSFQKEDPGKRIFNDQGTSVLLAGLIAVALVIMILNDIRERERDFDIRSMPRYRRVGHVMSSWHKRLTLPFSDCDNKVPKTLVMSFHSGHGTSLTPALLGRSERPVKPIAST